MVNIREFATEEEMYEILGRDAKGFNCGSGWAPVDGTVEEEAVEPVSVERERFIVCAYVGSSLMYVSAKGTTFDRAQAKLFTEAKAEAKAKAMRRRGIYDWKHVRVF